MKRETREVVTPFDFNTDMSIEEVAAAVDKEIQEAIRRDLLKPFVCDTRPVGDSFSAAVHEVLIDHPAIHWVKGKLTF